VSVAAAADAAAPVGRGGTTVNPWLIAVLVSLAVFMEVLDTTVANVVLPYIAGDMGVSSDESTWVVTTYLVANAVSLTASPYLARTLGRRTFFLGCLALFTISSVLCAEAWSLDSLLMFRLMQGLAGGGMVPVAQSILADSFPPEKRGQSFALFGVAVIVAPIVGPTLGGWLADNLSWRWCFQINGPVGLITIILISLVLRDSEASIAERAVARLKGGFDFIGFLLVATFLGSLEIALDRGLEDDWFSSNFIIAVTAVCALSFVLMIPWEMTRRDPMIDVRMVATRQFGACFIVMGASGAIMYSTTQFMPQMVQQLFGYTATWAGLVLSPGGIVTMAMMVVTGALSNRIQPKYLVVAGALLIGFSMYQLIDVYMGVGFWFFANSRMTLGAGMPFLFLPIITASYDGIPQNKTDMASALINASRNTGGSIGVSIAANILAHRQQFHQSRLVEHVNPANPHYLETMQQAIQHFMAHGSSQADAQGQALGWIAEQTQVQAALLAYIDVYWVLMVISLSIIPLALSLRTIKLGGGGMAMAH
jgi:DHA2 family multidrug resistance protein